MELNETSRRNTTQDEQTDVAPKKRWSAPQLTSVSIASMTEQYTSPGNDGAGSSTLS